MASPCHTRADDDDIVGALEVARLGEHSLVGGRVGASIAGPCFLLVLALRPGWSQAWRDCNTRTSYR